MGHPAGGQGESRLCLLPDRDVELAPFIAHPTIEMAGASPDGLVGTDGLVEIKCPNTATHIETLLTHTSRKSTRSRCSGRWPAPAGHGATLSRSTPAAGVGRRLRLPARAGRGSDRRARGGGKSLPLRMRDHPHAIEPAAGKARCGMNQGVLQGDRSGRRSIVPAVSARRSAKVYGFTGQTLHCPARLRCRVRSLPRSALRMGEATSSPTVSPFARSAIGGRRRKSISHSRPKQADRGEAAGDQAIWSRVPTNRAVPYLRKVSGKVERR